MEDIQELPDYLRNPEEADFRDLPQLKYVVEMAEKLCPNVGFLSLSNPFFNQGGTAIFLKRYFDGSIDTSFKEAYLENDNLQDSLEAFGIDPTAFWYLILFLKDYVDDESTGQKMEDNAYTQIYNLAAKLYEMGFYETPFGQGEYEGCENEGLLKLKVGKHWLNITDDKTLYSVFAALCSYLRRCQPKRQMEEIGGVWEEVNGWDIMPEYEHLFSINKKENAEMISIPETYKISYFTTYARQFLEPFTSNNKEWVVSKDKWLLISRVIYIIGYSDDVRYDTRKKTDSNADLDFLKGNYLKDRYKDKIRRTIYVQFKVGGLKINIFEPTPNNLKYSELHFVARFFYCNFAPVI